MVATKVLTCSRTKYPVLFDQEAQPAIANKREGEEWELERNVGGKGGLKNIYILKDDRGIKRSIISSN